MPWKTFLGASIMLHFGGFEAKAATITNASYYSYISNDLNGLSYDDSSDKPGVKVSKTSEVSTPAATYSTETSAIASGAEKPNVRTTALASNNNRYALADAYSYSEMTYDIEVVGLPSAKPVKVEYTALGIAQTVGEGEADISYQVHGDGVDVGEELSTSNVPSQFIRFKTSSFIMAIPNKAYSVDILASSEADPTSKNYSQITSNSSAYVDPYFSIDNTLSNYSLAFSAGVGNSEISSIPIPDTFSMLGAALLTVGAVSFGMRRRQLVKMIMP